MLAPFVPGKSWPVDVLPEVFSIKYTSVVPVFVITMPERAALAGTIKVAALVIVACPVLKG